jgi:acyl-CoA thioesterase
MDPTLIAQKAAQTMLSEDRASTAMGIVLHTVKPGYAVVSMEVRADMVNGHNTAHGGIVFSLADTAFACACNSHNVVNVAASCQINFTRPAVLGDRLLATATELSLGRRTGVYDVRIENGAGKLIAVFRGQSMSLNRPVFKEDN